MQTVEPESPLVLEEILLKLGYRITYKDSDVCVLDNPNDPISRPLCIPQRVGPTGKVAQDVMQQILFEAKLDLIKYLPLRNQVVQAPPEKYL